MNEVAIDTEKELEPFAKIIASIKIQDIPRIPPFVIPNWPKGISIGIDLGLRLITIPELTVSSHLRLDRGRRTISCRINHDGSIFFEFYARKKNRHRKVTVSSTASGATYYSPFRVDETRANIERCVALFIFRQLKEELLERAIKKAAGIVTVRNQVVSEIERAFEPFVPFIVANELEK